MKTGHTWFGKRFGEPYPKSLGLGVEYEERRAKTQICDSIFIFIFVINNIRLLYVYEYM